MKKITNTSENPNPEWLMGRNPNAIERQEAQGQKELVESSQLPRRCNRYQTDLIEQYKSIGVVVVGETKGDDLFLDVTLPKGWKIEATEHPMWNKLKDDKGRKRANIFYKAAFYDRDAFIAFEHQINFRIDRLGFLNDDYTRVEGEYAANKTPFVGRVTNSEGIILFETAHFVCDVEYNEPNNKGGYSDRYKEQSAIVENELEHQCLLFLNKNYPKYEDVNAYWD